MSKENIVKKITINIGGKDIEVTPEQALKLHTELGNLFHIGQPVKEYVFCPVPYSVPYVPTTTPYYYYYPHGIPYCTGTLTGSSSITIT